MGMFGKRFQLNEETIHIVEEIGRHMPGGFFIYKKEMPEELLYANRAVLNIFGCKNLEEFKELTGYTFKGMLHPDDYGTVSETIQRQVQENEEFMDYVEYRIIRRDGAVRWVDDYGHYTDTEAYGGIYYVFISDITEKHERMESDKIIQQALIDALSESYRALWLLTDPESDDYERYIRDEEGILVPDKPELNGKDLADYAEIREYYIRNTVVPEDQERLRAELSRDRILSRLKERPHFSISYQRLMDNGTRRYFRIEVARANMPDGRIGVVLGFRDVDEDVRDWQALQQQLQTQQLLRERQDKLITALSSDYWSVYYIELDKDEGVCYQDHADIKDGLKVGERFPYLATVTEYANKYVTESYREEFLRFTYPDAIREALKEERVIAFRYMVSRNGKETYEMTKIAGVRHPEDRDDHIVHAVGLCFTDVDAETRKNMETAQTLNDALATAEQANRAKTAFLSSMSHEIRTPMNAIIGLDNIALSDPDLSPKTRESLEKIGASAHHLLNIINDILDMSRIESGRMIIRNEEFFFTKTLEQVNTMIGDQCRDKELDYECRIIGKVDDYYIGDDMKLRQVLINILGNAVKFTPAGGKIRFIVQNVARFEGNSTLRFIISDTGIGMSREYLPKIFEAFSQEDSSSTNKYGSTGLGMSITKSLVKLMNGNIEVESEKGKGTTFTVTVTMADSGRKREEHETEDLQPQDMRVLVIDDDPVACEHAKVVMGQVGINCEAALSGEEGVEMVRVRRARREPYNLILVDWKMPGMDGVETTRRIRSIIGNDTAIIILTSYNWYDIVDEATRAGVDTFVPKPLFAATVLDEFRSALQKRRAGMQNKKADLRGRRILLAEDVAINADIMVMVLQMREMAADVAENGRIAVDKFAGHETGYYDAILMDMRMPEMDGLEATRLIRSMDREDAKTIPIIALTANAFDEDVQRSLQAGLNAHLSKPVEPDALFSTLESLIQ
ncbi:MAG: response regulator [Acidaminococcaceae bacterium]|nr:response regulator [Acidaminococcaceae bacterium]